MLYILYSTLDILWYIQYCFVFDPPTHTTIIIIINMQMLVGTYQCTGVPGEFEWKPGILTRVSIYDIIILRLCGMYMCMYINWPHDFVMSTKIICYYYDVDLV